MASLITRGDADHIANEDLAEADVQALQVMLTSIDSLRSNITKKLGNREPSLAHGNEPSESTPLAGAEQRVPPPNTVVANSATEGEANHVRPADRPARSETIVVDSDGEEVDLMVEAYNRDVALDIH